MEVKRKLRMWISTKLKNLIIEENKPVLFESNSVINSGKESYHNGNFIVKGSGSLYIGNYCAFGNNIKIILSNHNYNYASIQYTFYYKRFGKLPYRNKRGKTIIGSDVWIGDNVIILPNVKIGNGVCIGAGSIVTKDIPSYTVCAGVPAKILKYRFSEDKIKELLEIKWWNWSDEKINKNRDFFFKSITNK